MVRDARRRAPHHGDRRKARNNPTMLSPEELERYARHIVLREVGGPGQAALKEASVLVIGAGGLGAPALMYLAAAGIGEVHRSEEHTSELQSHLNLVCRLLLEKKKQAGPEASADCRPPHILFRVFTQALPDLGTECLPLRLSRAVNFEPHIAMIDD